MANAGDFFAQLAGAIGRAAYGGPKLNPNYGKPTDDITIDDEGNWYQKGKAVSQEDAQLADPNRYRTPGFGERFWSPDVAATEEAGNRAQAEALAKQDIARTVQRNTFAGLGDSNRNNALANAALLVGGTNALTTGGIDPNAIARGVSNYGGNIAGTQSAGDIATATAGKTDAEIARDIAAKTAAPKVAAAADTATRLADIAAGERKLTPLELAGKTQATINALGTGSSTPTADPNWNVSYSLDANGNVIRKLVPSAGMSLKDRLLYGALGKSVGGPRILRNKNTGETLGDIVASVPGLTGVVNTVTRPAAYTAGLVNSLMPGGGAGISDLYQARLAEGITPNAERKALSPSETTKELLAEDPTLLTEKEQKIVKTEQEGNKSYPAISIESLEKEPLPLPSGAGEIYSENGEIKFRPYRSTEDTIGTDYTISDKDKAYVKKVIAQLKKEDVARKAVANPQ